MGSLYLGGPTIQEVDGKMMMGLSIYGVAVISGSLYSRFYGMARATHERPHMCTSYVLKAYLYCVYALVGRVISIRDPYICAVSWVCANELHAVFHGPVVCAVKT